MVVRNIDGTLAGSAPNERFVANAHIVPRPSTFKAKEENWGVESNVIALCSPARFSYAKYLRSQFAIALPEILGHYSLSCESSRKY